VIYGLIMIGTGLLLVALEFFLPGGIVGAAGGIIFLSGLVLFAVDSPSLLLTIAVVIASLALFVVMIRYLIKRIQRTKSTFYLSDDQEGYRASKWAEELMGEEGLALSDMRPAGHIRIDGTQYQAVSKMGYLRKGTKIKVIGGEGAHLVVRSVEE
jgi:membrane-bound serine protease (ClpP class)